MYAAADVMLFKFNYKFGPVYSQLFRVQAEHVKVPGVLAVGAVSRNL